MTDHINTISGEDPLVILEHALAPDRSRHELAVPVMRYL